MRASRRLATPPLDNYRCNDYTRSVAGRIRVELKQNKPFDGLEQEAFLNIQRTADDLLQTLSLGLRPYAVSPPQYNVLRILRGAEPSGLCCREIGDRMITRDPDITRLLDRLERRGLVGRGRDKKDRRVVTARITSSGLELLADLDEPIARLGRDQLGHLGKPQLVQLIELLERVRDKG